MIIWPSIRELQKKSRHLNAADVDILLVASIGREKEFIYTHPEYRPTLRQRLRFRYFLRLYKRGYSVATIIQRKEFYGLDFYVNKHVLVPRPETELMVESAIDEIEKINIQYPISNILLIDVGTGSGCIPIAIMKTLKHKNIKTIATDISKRALRAAKKNARKQGVEIKFFQGRLLQPIIKQCNNETKEQWNNVVITANLPYLTEEQFKTEPSIQREPKTALVAKKGGLALYSELLKQMKCFQKKYPISNIQYLLLMEIDPSQSQTIISLIAKRFPNAEVQIKKDLAGRDRLVRGRISKF